MLIGNNGLYFLNVQFRANFDSQFAYYGYVLLQFNIAFYLLVLPCNDKDKNAYSKNL